MEELRKMNNEDIIHDIKISKYPEYTIFLTIELTNRYNNRPIEEQHLSFNEWEKILLLRDDNLNNKIVRYDNKKIEPIVKKNKEYFKNKNIEIPDKIKKMSTKELLNLRFKPFYTDEVYAELANRPHIQNKKERQKDFSKKQKKILKFKK